MRAIWRQRLLAAALVLTLAGIGCNPLTGMYFLMFGVDNKVPPEFPLATPDREVRVMVLAYSSPDVRTELVGIDRQIGTAIVRDLDRRCKYNKERVAITPIHLVEKFKSENPNWRGMGPAEIGHYFDVDYVIDMEIVNLSLYEQGSQRTLYKGRCKIDLAVLDLHKPNDGPVYKVSFSSEYPRTRGPIPVADDNNLEKFRDQFVSRIATDICWKFTTHLSQEEYQCD
jgi:hypothetical protein